MRSRPTIAAAIAAAVFLPVVSTAQDAAKRLEVFKAAGPNAELTVFSGRLMGRPRPELRDFIGQMLERAGMQKLELSASEFQREDPATMEQVGTAFSAFVRRNPIHTEYALYTELLGTPGIGVSEVRGIVVDRQGNLVWSDRQTSADEDFRNIERKEPMECVLLLINRLRQTLSLEDPLRRDAPEGKIARRLAEETGLPTADDKAAMKTALESARASLAGATVAVFPVLAAGTANPAQAAHLAQLLNQEKLAKAEVSVVPLVLPAAPGPNELKRLWHLARAFREHARQSPPPADYALYAEYGIGRGSVGFVHFVICDRRGDWVIVDMQNDHHNDFQSIDPKSADDCDRLVIKRLAGYLR